MARVSLGTLSVDLPDGWAEITDSIDVEDRPYTLAKRDGVGALQFSVALYREGPLPEATTIECREMVEDFGRKRGLADPTAVVAERGPPLLAAGSFVWDDNFLRVWYASNGRDFAFISYTSADKQVLSELAECEQIVRSIEFRPNF